MQTFSPLKLSIEFFRNGQRQRVDMITESPAEARALKDELTKHSQCFVAIDVVATPQKETLQEHVETLAKNIIKENSIPLVGSAPAVVASSERSASQAAPVTAKQSSKRSLDADEGEAAEEALTQPLAKRLMTSKKTPSVTEFLRKWRLRRPSTVSVPCVACSHAPTHRIWITNPSAMVQARKVLLCKEHATEEYKKFYGNASAEFLLDREYEKIRVFEGGKVACAATSGRTLEQFLGLTALPGHLPNVRLCASCGGDKAGFMIDVKSWSFAECCPIQKETPMCRIHAEEYYREENKKHAETAVKELEATFGQPGTIARSEIRRDAAPAEEGGLIESAELHKITKLVKKYCDTHCRYRKSAVCDSRICPDMVTHEWLRPTLDDETHTVKKCWAHFKSDHVGRLPTLVKFCAAPFCRRTPTRFNANDISLHAGRLLFEFRCAEHAKPKDVAIADE